jgi:5-methylcytosine-specific restriction endonuclease McrA
MFRRHEFSLEELVMGEIQNVTSGNKSLAGENKTLASEDKSLKFLSDEELWSSTIKQSEVERISTLRVISFLEEINSRKLHLRRGYSSLHEYCVKVLKYSDGGAYRRIKAMRLVQDLPETRKSIESGELNLTTASQLQHVIEIKKKARKPLAQEEKLELFDQLKEKSKREVEQTIATICPEVVKKTESQRFITSDMVQKTLVISQRLNEKIERLKRLRAHEKKDFASILEDLVDRELKRVDPLVKTSKLTRDQSLPKTLGPIARASPEKLSSEINEKSNAAPSPSHSRYVPAGVRREVWTKSQGKCSYIDFRTGKKCESVHFLQIDHIIPFAKGGPTAAENLRLLCANHNQLHALDQFGKHRPRM